MSITGHGSCNPLFGSNKPQCSDSLKLIVEIEFSRKCRFGNFEKIKVYGEKFSLDSDDFSDKKTLHNDFSVRHRKSYLNCLKKFIENKNNLFMNEAILTQKICADALKKARYK